MNKDKKCNKGNGLWLGGCFLALYYTVGLVFYMILFFSKITTSDWLTVFFLIFGLVGLVCIFPIVMSIVLKASVYTSHMDYMCEVEKEKEKEKNKRNLSF